jgi:hypothetical protein
VKGGDIIMNAEIFKRMRLLSMGFMIFILFVVMITIGWTEQGNKEKFTQAQRREIIKAIKEQLNNTTWQIELKEVATDKKKRKVINDTLRFTNSRIESESLVSEGFSPTNFTVRIRGKNTIIWETMQTSEEKGLAFWRGEIKRDIVPMVMRGVLSRHLDEKKVRDYTFISEEKEGITFEEIFKIEEVPVVQEEEVLKETPKETPVELKEQPVKEEPISMEEKSTPSETEPEEVERKESKTKAEPEAKKEANKEEGQKKKKGWFWGR